MVDPGFQAQEQRRGQVEAIRENSARYASSYVSYQTTGWGEFLAPDCQRFTTTFVKRPSVAHACSIDGDTLVDGRFPRITAGVHKWLQNDQGFYIGAWLFFVVETFGLQSQPTFVMPTDSDGAVATVALPYPTPADPNYSIIHDFTFTGVAMKAIPAHLLED